MSCISIDRNMMKFENLGRVELSSGATHLVSCKNHTEKSQRWWLAKRPYTESTLTIVGGKTRLVKPTLRRNSALIISKSLTGSTVSST